MINTGIDQSHTSMARDDILLTLTRIFFEFSRFYKTKNTAVDLLREIIYLFHRLYSFYCAKLTNFCVGIYFQNIIRLLAVENDTLF